VATDLPETTAFPEGEASPPARTAPKRAWRIVRAILFLACLGAATFGLSHLTRSVGSTLLSVLLTMLWLAGIYWLLNAVRGRDGPFAKFVRAGFHVGVTLTYLVAAKRVRHLRHAENAAGRPPEWTEELEDRLRQQQVAMEERFGKLQEQAAEQHRQQMEAINELRRKVDVPRWKRVVVGTFLFVVTTVASWAMSYYVPAPPAAATSIVTHPSQPSPSQS
jgi:hypothetical protein